MSFQFTPDQQKAITGICNTLLKPTAFKYSVITVLTGAAGTGKTTVIGEIIKQLCISLDCKTDCIGFEISKQVDEICQKNKR